MCHSVSQNCEELYGFLFRHYQEKSFWWEMMVLLRKLGFAAIVHQPKAPEQQTMLGILCLLSYISLVTGARPYVAYYLNWMDKLGAAFATSLAFSGLVMFGGYDTQLSTNTVRLHSVCGLPSSCSPPPFPALLGALPPAAPISSLPTPETMGP